MSKVAVIIPAAGRSERFGKGESKTLAKIDGRPVFLRTIEHFINRDEVIQTILVVAVPEWEQVRATYGANLGFMGVELIEGGEERMDSVAAGLERVKEEADLVAIHDAARPCVAARMIDGVFAEAAKSGAAILASPITGTIKRVNKSGVIDATVSREALFEAQTPQVFRRELIVEAYANRATGEEPVTDDAQLVEAMGHPVSVVKSDPTNLKITTKADIILAGAILKARPKKPIHGLGAFEEAQW
ncbi:MAG: 2-C-methyl-D-erythritol 4-phosphate cytidylyltransferase [Phycisphaerae bacterium]|nr:2-C-methyl-D-erythritol 4-phosphate cytidylyltransferase [Phycisphaerae bacterium]